MLEDSVQELEFRLELLRDDLAKAQDRYRLAQEELVSAEAKVQLHRKNLRFLKENAQVILMSEFISTRNMLNNAIGSVQSARKRQSQIASELDQLTKEIRDAELSLRIERTRVKPTAKILEFPNAER